MPQAIRHQQNDAEQQHEQHSRNTDILSWQRYVCNRTAQQYRAAAAPTAGSRCSWLLLSAATGTTCIAGTHINYGISHNSSRQSMRNRAIACRNTSAAHRAYAAMTNKTTVCRCIQTLLNGSASAWQTPQQHCPMGLLSDYLA